MTERELTKLIMGYLKWVPNSSFKKVLGGLGMRGILDIIGCWEGKYIELEVKTEKGRLSVEQRARIEEIRAAGGIAEVVRSLEEVHSIFNKDGRITIQSRNCHLRESASG